MKSIKLMLVLLIIVIGSANAQYVTYESNPLPPAPVADYSMPQARQPQRQQAYYPVSQTKPSAQLVKGYFWANDNYKGVAARIVEENGKVYVTGVRELGTDYWINFEQTKIPVSRIQRGERGSDMFEYKVYVPSLQKDVYL